MERINWNRVLLGGGMAGLVLIALTTGCAALFGAHNPIWIGLRSLTRNAAALLFALLVFLFLGMLMTFWYAAMRPRFGPGPKTAAIAGLAVWLIGVAEVLKSFALSRPVELWPGPALPLLYLAIIIVSTEAGAWLYKET